MKILIIGASGMLGHVLYTELSKTHEVRGTVRSNPWHPELITGITVSFVKHDEEKFEQLLSEFKPDVALNCIGIIKQIGSPKNKINSIAINSLLPQLMAQSCQRHNVKLVHFSTDCVFLGVKGNYKEDDIADARDLYGLSKYLGEISGENCLTIRTSFIGHELNSNVSLVDWFLSQKIECKGYKQAIYTGFPTVEIASILSQKILPAFVSGEISGLYQLSSNPINKFDLLGLIARIYGKKIQINESNDLVINRSLDSTLLREKLNFLPRDWESMIKTMHEQFISSKLYKHKEFYL
ncbi:MAG: SDR family oxidoreductase [Bacteriovoracaceae bacterium]|nr:SDR family oxidoreductase [Bacteriovoracaceae bacterium]